MKSKIRFFILLLLITWTSSPCAYADSVGLIAQGASRMIFSVLEIPKQMIIHSTQAFPLGLVAGTVGGTMKAVAGTVVGAVDVARGAAPYAKYLVFL